MGNKLDMHEKLRLRVLSLSVTEHGNYFTKESVEDALGRMDIVPLVADMSGDKFGGHNYKTKYEKELNRLESYPDMDIVGYVDNTCDYRWVVEDGEEFLEIDAKVHKLYSHKFLELFNEKYGGMAGHSMEIRDVEFEYDEDRGADRVDYFNFSGFCILGDEYVPAVSGSVLTYSLKEAGIGMSIEEMLKVLGLSSVEELERLIKESQGEGEVGEGKGAEEEEAKEESKEAGKEGEVKEKSAGADDKEGSGDVNKDEVLKELEAKLDKLSESLDNLVKSSDVKFTADDVANIMKYAGGGKGLKPKEEVEEKDKEDDVNMGKGVMNFSAGTKETDGRVSNFYDITGGVVRGDGTVGEANFEPKDSSILRGTVYQYFNVVPREDTAYIKHVFTDEAMEVIEHVEGMGTPVGSVESDQIHVIIPERKTTVSKVSVEAYDHDIVSKTLDKVMLKKLARESTKQMFSDFKESGQVVSLEVEASELDTPEKVLEYISHFITTNDIVKGGVLFLSPRIFSNLYNAGDNSKGQLLYDGQGGLILDQVSIVKLDMGEDVDMVYTTDPSEIDINTKIKKVDFGGEKTEYLAGAMTVHYNRSTSIATGNGEMVAVTTGVLDLSSPGEALVISVK